MSATFRRALGMALVVAGLVAVPLPILPGLPLIIAGAAMLGPDHPVVRTARSWLEKTGIWRQERNQNELSNVQG